MNASQFLAKTIKAPSGCWIWMGAIHGKGYGTLSWPDRTTTAFAHRVSHELFIGPIPDGLFIDHLCRTRRCVNPLHLQAVTQRVNTLRGMSFSAINAAKTGCSRGHRYTPENTYQHKGKRYCRECLRINQRASKRRRRERALKEAS